MPKKKQVTFQNSVPGRYIPRDDPPPGSVFRSGANDNRFNARMAELLASSEAMNDENELASTTSPQDNPSAIIVSEPTPAQSPRTHSKLLHRRIATMLEILKKPNDEVSTLPSTFSHMEHKSQPITFGQLRQATVASSSLTIIQEKSNSQQKQFDLEEKYQKSLPLYTRDNHADMSSKPSTKQQVNRARLYYSPSLEQLFEEQNVVPQTKKEDEQSPRPPLTMDEILAKHYSRANLTTDSESHLPSSPYANTMTGFYIHPSGPRWSTSQSNQHDIPSPPLLVLNEQNRNRPPPPSYSSSVVHQHRTSLTVPSANQHLIHSSTSSSLLEHVQPGSSTFQHLSTKNTSITHSNSPSFVPVITNPITNNSMRPPPPRYRSPTSNPDRSHSASSQQPRPGAPINNNAPTGFNREFSRLLYGKDTGKTRRHKLTRKAFSDPDKKSIEEAKRSFEKTRRRVTTHLNKTDRDKGDDNDETETDTESSKTRKQDFNFPPRRRSQRQAELLEKNRESARKAIVPANPLLKRRIPSFLRVYSQASSSNDILLQWHLFTLPELESFNSMMTRLYKNENLARVQLYEIYRSALHSALASKTSSNTDDESESINNTPL